MSGAIFILISMYWFCISQSYLFQTETWGLRTIELVGYFSDIKNVYKVIPSNLFSIYMADWDARVATS